MAVIAVGILPMMRILLQHADTNSVAGVVPQLTDLRDLFLLWTAGLAAARQGFTDSAHLTLPATAELSPAIWFVVGMVICGLPAVYGLARALRMDATRRLQAVLAVRKHPLAGRTSLWLRYAHGHSYLDTTTLSWGRLSGLPVGRDWPGMYPVEEVSRGCWRSSRSSWRSHRWCRTTVSGRKAMAGRRSVDAAP